jgi:hypothetical protein
VLNTAFGMLDVVFELDFHRDDTHFSCGMHWREALANVEMLKSKVPRPSLEELAAYAAKQFQLCQDVCASSSHAILTMVGCALCSFPATWDAWPDTASPEAYERWKARKATSAKVS